MNIRRTVALALLLVVVHAAGRNGTPELAASATQSDLDRWLAAVREHEPGRADDATRLVSDWSLRQLVSGVLPLRNAVEAPALAAVLKRGAMLHTDVAMIHVLSGEAFRRVPPGGALHANYVEHLDVARRLLDWVDHPEGDADVQQWYRAVTAWMFSQRLLVPAVHHLDEVERVLGLDSHAVFDRGTLDEMLASLSVQNLVMSRAYVRGGMPTVGSSRYHFSRAERSFTRVLELDPAFAEARVRLGRVQSALGQPDRAVEQLEGVPPLSDDPVVRYYAFLFLGRAREARGDDDDAVLAAYQQATLIYPNAQSALLAIGQLAGTAGAGEVPLAAVNRVLALPPDERSRFDPWWVYYAGIGRDAPALVGALHAHFARLPR